MLRSRAPGRRSQREQNSSTSAVPIDVNDRHMLRAFARTLPTKSATSRRKRRVAQPMTRRRSTIGDQRGTDRDQQRPAEDLMALVPAQPAPRPATAHAEPNAKARTVPSPRQ